MTLTQKIFAETAPYGNSLQTSALRVLFVCSVGMLRSPTAQMVATGHGMNARAAGSDVDAALIPMSVNLIMWADKIVFMNRENYEESIKTFFPVGYDEEIKRKSLVWNIPDNYSWGDNTLWGILEEKIKGLV